MTTFNVHYTCKNNQRHTIQINAKDGDDARVEARKQVQGIAYISKVKVVK